MRPQGREEVSAALLDAANQLFGERGPDGVSVRDVAAAADVNHALLHRHFGSKEKLLQMVLADHARAFRAAAKGYEDPLAAAVRMFEVVEARPAFWRILAHLLMDQRPPEDLVQPDGGLARLADLARALRTDEAADGIRADVALAAALGFGWLLFGPFLSHSLGEPLDEVLIRARMRRAFAFLLEGETPDSAEAAS